MECKFTEIYDKNIWGSSGTGSKYSHNNKWFLNQLKYIINKYNIKNILDIGCGDWEIMKHFNFEDVKYTGIDCVKSVIDNNNEKYKNNNINFIHQDIFINIPKNYDLIIIKDVLQHYQTDKIRDILNNIINNNKYVYCINGYKFTRDKSKNGWTNRILDKKYHYHPISFNEDELNYFKKYIIESKTRGAKEYNLMCIKDIKNI